MYWPDVGVFGAGFIVGWVIHRFRGHHRRRWSFRFDWDDDSTIGSPEEEKNSK